MIREVQKEAREYPQCVPLTDSAPETIDYSFEDDKYEHAGVYTTLITKQLSRIVLNN